MRSAPLLARVFAQIKEVAHVHMPRLDIHGDSALARAQLIDGDCDVVGDL